MKTTKTTALLALAVAAGLGLAGCTNDADVASYNLSKDADNFKIDRRIVFYNGITDTYLLSIEGRCALTADTEDSQVEVTCKTGEGEYKKHYLGISDNVTYFAEQLDPASVSSDHYKVTFKPTAIVPTFENTSGE